MYMYRLYIDILYILLINLFIYMYLYVCIYIISVCVCACVIINPVNHFEHGNANVGSWLFG